MYNKFNAESKFENFKVNEKNEIAFTCAKAVAKSVVEKRLIYNPVFIHGGTESGKTHLLSSIANYVRMEDK